MSFLRPVMNAGYEALLRLDPVTEGCLFAGIYSAHMCRKMARKYPITAIHLGVSAVFFTGLAAYRFMMTWSELYASSYQLYTRVHCTRVTDELIRVERFACDDHSCRPLAVTDAVGDCASLQVFGEDSVVSTVNQAVRRITSTEFYNCNALECEKTPHRIELISDAEPK